MVYHTAAGHAGNFPRDDGLLVYPLAAGHVGNFPRDDGLLVYSNAAGHVGPLPWAIHSLPYRAADNPNPIPRHLGIVPFVIVTKMNKKSPRLAMQPSLPGNQIGMV